MPLSRYHYCLLVTAMTDDALVDASAKRNLDLVARIGNRGETGPRVIAYYEKLAEQIPCSNLLNRIDELGRALAERDYTYLTEGLDRIVETTDSHVSCVKLKDYRELSEVQQPLDQCANSSQVVSEEPHPEVRGTLVGCNWRHLLKVVGFTSWMPSRSYALHTHTNKRPFHLLHEF